MIFLLDTTTCVALIRDQPLLARARAEEAIVRGEMLLVTGTEGRDYRCLRPPDCGPMPESQFHFGNRKRLGVSSR